MIEAWRAEPGTSQALFLACPVYEVLFEGTRGPGKTEALLVDFARDCGRGFGDRWRGILFRRTYKQLEEVSVKIARLKPAFPGSRLINDDTEWHFPGGEVLFLRYLEKERDSDNYQGHEYPWIGFEELTTWPNLDCYESVRACNRTSVPGIKIKYRATANPHGVGHNAVKQYWVDPAPAGTIIRNEQGMERVRITGHWSENKALLAADPNYPLRLRSEPNPNKRKAWYGGRWDITSGGIIDDLWDERVHLVTRPWKISETPKSWRIERALDWGSARPFSVGWWARTDGTEAPNGIAYPKNSRIRLNEWYGWTGKANEGLGLTAQAVAGGIVKREKDMGIWGRVQIGPADLPTPQPGETDMLDKFRKNGVRFFRPKKPSGSIEAGWEAVRDMLHATLQKPWEEPVLLVFPTCAQFRRTVPSLPRDENKPERHDTDAEDHIADETRYVCLAPKMGIGTVRVPV